MRTRMYGGVGGEEPRGFPLSRLRWESEILEVRQVEAFQAERPVGSYPDVVLDHERGELLAVNQDNLVWKRLYVLSGVIGKT
jgi:hypothetical protein